MEGKFIEANELQKGWRRMRLGDVILSLKNGIVAEQNFSRKGFQVARIETISNGFVDLGKVGWVNLPVENFKDFKLRNGDVLFSHINSVERLGNCAIYEGVPEDLYHGTNLLRIRVSENTLVPHFLLYWLRSDHCKKCYRANARRAIGQASLNQKDIREIPILISPLFEQKRIVSKIQGLMQEAGRARAACERQFEAAKALFAAYLRQVFQSEETRGWEKKRLGDVCSSESGVWGDEAGGSTECHFILRSNNIKDGRVIFDKVAVRKVESKYLSGKSLIAGDILVATSSGSKDLVGKSAIFTPPDDRIYLFSNFTMRLRAVPDLVDSFYLYFYLQSPQAKSALQLIQDTTTGLRNLDRREFLKRLVPVPFSLKDQKRVAARLKEKLEDVEKLRIDIEKQLEAIGALPQAILRKAFRGEI